jgi:hypothetical protein
MSSEKRLKALQAAVAAAGVDGLLFVGGIDGKNHAGTREALAWLLTGLSGRNLFGVSALDAGLDEVVLLIMADAVRLYVPKALWVGLQPRLGRWRRLQVWMPPDAIVDDVEAVEEHKIRSFIAMVRGVYSIGVPLPSTEPTTGPTAAVESWPLVQSFALQDFEALTGGAWHAPPRAARRTPPHAARHRAPRAARHRTPHAARHAAHPRAPPPPTLHAHHRRRHAHRSPLTAWAHVRVDVRGGRHTYTCVAAVCAAHTRVRAARRPPHTRGTGA